MPKNISLSSPVVAVIYDLVHSLDGPTSTDAILTDICRARLVKQALDDAFIGADVDPAKIERPELPKIGQKLADEERRAGARQG